MKTHKISKIKGEKGKDLERIKKANAWDMLVTLMLKKDASITMGAEDLLNIFMMGLTEAQKTQSSWHLADITDDLSHKEVWKDSDFTEMKKMIDDILRFNPKVAEVMMPQPKPQEENNEEEE